MNKIQQLQSYLKEQSIDAAFITNPDNVFYVSGFQSNPHERLLGVMVFQQAEPFLICPQMEMPDAKSAGWSGEIVGHVDTENAMEVLHRTASSRGVALSKLAIEKSHMTVDRYDALISLFGSIEFVQLDDKINALRVVKDEEELQILREAAALADYAIEVGTKAIKEGITEIEVMTEIELALKKRGVTHMSFDTTVLSGPKAASPHGKTGDRKIQKGDLVLFDLGVIHKGYCSDITRTVAFGEPNEEQKAVYDVVLQAELAAVNAVKPGITAAELDQTARQVIEDAGYGEFFTHRLGHGLGISVHEFPSLHGSNDMKMESGMVFTIEPGVYVPGKVGVRIEDDVAVTADGVEVLTKFPKELLIL
ncbi:Xaa-Pro peptidase family protein [Planococcus sp. N028]|uniref:Xaa-Pro peptidase family protein n=1 Tax=Planococcus shixiaomingii TaxID=3058393 RepID=A0ABT8MX97_9BACL|nr:MULTISPECIES: Xaa-Pro peptidase family protein [unclassified Planococcus (in: firmicutes)]MDN7240253.1 Xaa-Pro peptidase family protein [Planococcus sp. N028]WKA56156.1 Xaa-Pro peptidase family protein [Planococcus sp. N022]